MNNNIETSINQIIKASHENKLVFFVGAGVSLNAEVPTWTSLVKEMQNELGLTNDDENDLLKIPQLYHNEQGQEMYNKKIRSVLKYNEVNYNDNETIKGILEGMIALNPKHIITTNYDNLIEQAIRNARLPFSIIAEDRDLAYLDSDRTIVKMHGDFEKFNMVLKEDDFLNYSANFPLIENFVKGLFSYNTIVFVGISFTDINLKYILERVHHILDKDTPSCYLLYTGKEPLKQSQISYYWKKHIKILSFSEVCGNTSETNQGDKLKEILKKIKESSEEKNKFEIYKITDSDTQAQKFIKTIKHIKAIYEQYDDLGCVRPEIIVRVPPFGDSSSSKHNYANGHLTTKNKTLFDLFIFIAEWLEITNNEIVKTNQNIKIKDYIALSTPEKEADKIIDEILNNKTDLFFIIKKMYQTPIHSIKYDERIDNIPDTVYIPIIAENHSNLFSLDSEFQFNNYITKLKSFNSNWKEEISDLSELLSIAFHNTKISNYIVAFQIFDSVAKKAWEKRKYTLYFIACYNIHQIKIKAFNEKKAILDNEKKYEIKIIKEGEKIEEITRIEEFYDKKIKAIYYEMVEKIKNDMEKILPVMWKNNNLLENMLKKVLPYALAYFLQVDLTLRLWSPQATTISVSRIS
jgi:SIR2-like domain